jgi:membrane-associated protein
VQALIDLFHRIYDVQAIVTFGGLVALVVVIFAETGLLVGFFLPGDSLLVTAGIFCTSANPVGRPVLNIATMIVTVSVAAIVGDTVGYWIGASSGPRLFSRDDSLLFKKRYLIQTHEFYERHGGKTIIIARFMPIIRTFAPVVAGAASMSYRRFLSFNVFGGIFWVASMSLLGYGLASVYPSITKHIDKLIIVIIFVSLLPALIGWARNRAAKRNAAPAPRL